MGILKKIIEAKVEEELNKRIPKAEDRQPEKKREETRKMSDKVFVGLEGNWMNGRMGDRKKDAKPGDKSLYNMKPVSAYGGSESDYYKGLTPWNGDYKCIVIANLTPIQADGTKLFPDEPENELVGHVKYYVVVDGRKYVEDEIQDSIIEVSNHKANFGLTPRLVFGPGINGHHSFTFGAELVEHDVSVELPYMRIG